MLHGRPGKPLSISSNAIKYSKVSYEFEDGHIHTVVRSANRVSQ